MQNHRARARLDHLVWVTDADRVTPKRIGRGPQTTLPEALSLRAGDSDYERYSLSNNPVNSRSWNYRGCWHQTCPPVVIG